VLFLGITETKIMIDDSSVYIFNSITLLQYTLTEIIFNDMFFVTMVVLRALFMFLKHIFKCQWQPTLFAVGFFKLEEKNDIVEVLNLSDSKSISFS
jgi:hypothetical protein